jgi:hypothetical protein
MDGILFSIYNPAKPAVNQQSQNIDGDAAAVMHQKGAEMNEHVHNAQRPGKP